MEALGYWLYDTFWLAQLPKFPFWPRLFSSAGTKRVRIIAGARIDASFPFSPLRGFGDRRTTPIPRLSAHPSPQPGRGRAVNAPERSEADRARRSRAGLTARNRAWHGPTATPPIAALQRVPWSVGLPLSDGNFASKFEREMKCEMKCDLRREMKCEMERSDGLPARSYPGRHRNTGVEVRERRNECQLRRK